MELQNIISAESLRDLLTQARKAGWEHLIYSMGGDQTTKGDISWHQHVWRHGNCQISMDLGRIDITSQAAAHAHGSAATGWSFPVETLDMDGLTLTLSVALAQFGETVPSNSDRVTLSPVDEQDCIWVEFPSDEEREAQAAYDDQWGTGVDLGSYGC